MRRRVLLLIMPLSPRLVGLLSLPPLLWASNAVVGRMLAPLVPPMALNSLRWACTAMLLALWGWRVFATRERRADIQRRWRYFALLGLLGFGAYNALQYQALATSDPINVTLLASSVPAFALLAGWLFFRTPPRRLQVVGTGFCAMGVVTVICRGDLHLLMRVKLAQGDLLMLLAAFCWACYSWLLARRPAHMLAEQAPRITTSDIDRPWNLAEFLLVQTLFGLLFCGASAGIEWSLTHRAVEWTALTAAGVLYIALFPSLLAYALWDRAVREGGPHLSALFTNLTPIYAALLSTLLLGETPKPYHGIALLWISGGIVLSSRPARTPSSPS